MTTTKKALLFMTVLLAFAVRMATQNAQQNAAPANPVAPTATGTVQGTVTREGTTDPIPDVVITLTGRGYGSTMNAQMARQVMDALGRGATIPDELIQQAQETIANGAPAAARGAAPSTPPFSATTDSTGHFEISNVPVGEATLRAQLEGYFGTPINGQSPSGVSKQVTITAQQTADVRLSMVPGGTISGRISDSGGKPVSNAPVQALVLAYVNGIPTLQISNIKTTDDRGEYRLFRMAPGEYFLAASPRFSAPGANRTASTEVPVTTMYPGVTDRSRATPIALKGGDELSGVNMQVMTSPGVKISGKVTSSLLPGPVSGGRGALREPIASISWTLHNADALPDFIGGNPVTASPDDGTFQLSGIAPGVYDLIARMPVAYGWGGQNPPERATGAWAFGRTIVDVRGQNLEDINILVTPGVDVKGRVIVDGKPASPNIRLSLSPDDNTENINDGPTGNIYNQVSQYPVRIETDGSFAFPVIPPGQYRFQATLGYKAPVQVVPTAAGARGQAAAAPVVIPEPVHITLPANAYLADIRQGGVSVYDNGLVVGTQTVAPLDVIVNTDGGSIDGSVIGPDRKPAAAGMNVVLIPAENRRQNAALYKTARTDAQGHFAMNIVPPGQYRLFAWESVRPGAYQNADFLRAYEDRGTIVNVSAGAKVNTQVGLIPN